MGPYVSKLQTLCLPAQSGKTRKVEEMITEFNITECEDILNIIMTTNNIILAEQTKTRMILDLAVESEEGADDAVIKGDVLSWTSAKKECNIKPADLILRFLEPDQTIEMVVLCTNAIRLKLLEQVLKRLAKFAPLVFTKKINIWIDEADKTIGLWSKYEELLSIPVIHQITLVTATPHAIFKKYGSLQMMGFQQTHPDCYRGLKDSVKFEEDDKKTQTAAEYVQQIVLKYRDRLVRPGMRAFIPGGRKCQSHNDIADFLYKKMGFVVIIINSQRKEILVPGKLTAIDLGPCLISELSVKLAKLYNEHNWERYPLAITGLECVKRGVTFQCDGFIFTCGIIPPIVDANEAYQTMARLFGNVGHLPNYKPVEIYTSSVMFKKVEKLENTAVNLPRMIFEENIVQVTQKDAKRAQNFDDEQHWTLHERDFTTLEETKAFIKERRVAHNLTRQGGKKALKEEDKTDGGFYTDALTTTKGILFYDDVKKAHASWDKLSGFGIDDPTNPTNPVHSRTYVCYKDTNDPKSITFVTRVVEFDGQMKKKLKAASASAF